MDLYEALHTRRTIHRYRRDPLPEGAMERALAAAVMAPNHRLTWPWRFLRVGRDSRQSLVELACSIKGKPDAPCTPELVAKTRSKILNPAELIVISTLHEPDPAIARENYAATACAIQNIQLALTAEGVGAKWSSGTLTTHPSTYRCLSIDPDAEEVVAFLWAGMADHQPTTPARPPLESFVRSLP